MSQETDEDLDAFLDMFDSAEEPKPTPAPATAPVEEELTDGGFPDLGSDPVEEFEAPMVSTTLRRTAVESATRLVAEPEEDQGDDALDFLENSGMKRDRQVPDIMKPWMQYHKFTRVQTVEELRRIIDECIKRGYCSLDLETTGLDNRIVFHGNGAVETVDKIVGYCISYDGYEGFYIPVRHKPEDGGPNLNVGPLAEVDAEITRLCVAAIPEGTPEEKEKDLLSYKCEPPKVVIAFWNAQFDHEFLYPVTGIDWWHPASFEDGVLACFCINAGDKGIGLKPKAKQLLKDKDGNPYEMIELKELFMGRSKDIRFDKLAPDEPGVLRYAGSDAICTYLMCHPKFDLISRCYARHAFTYKLEKQLTEALRPMERNRGRIARDNVRAILVEYEAKKADVLARILAFAFEERGIVELDPNSPKQLGEFLFGPAPKGLDLSPKPERNEKSQQYKTDGDSLEELASLPNAPSILKDIVEYRKAEKFIGTYLLSLVNNPDENDELRFSFKQTGAGSGRFSAPAGKPEHGYSGIPIHGIPKESEVRRSFVSRPGYVMVKCDYAAEELRIAANVAGEQVWIDEFMNGTGDLHTITARSIFGKQNVTKEERNIGKIVNFLLLYGGGPKAVMRNTGCDEMEGKRRKQGFDKSVPTFIAWAKEQHKKVKRDLGVTTPFGRWLAIPDANSPDGAIRSACERHATNYQIQGGGADILKIAMVMLHKRFHRAGWLRNGGDDSVRMLLCVHDEIVFEIRADRVAEVVPIIVEIMESPGRMPTPKWRVPLVVAPLIGFNWASGFDAKRAAPGQIANDNDEVLLNGFIYSLVRKPKMDKKDNIIENLDQNEVLDGKKFRVVDAPWITQARLPDGSAPPPMTGGGPSTPTPPRTPSQPPVAARPAHVPAAFVANHGKAAAKTLKLRLEKLNPQTSEQVLDIILASIDNDDGVDLHITDPVGETLIGPGRFPVLKDKLIRLLGEKNLLCIGDLEHDAATA